MTTRLPNLRRLARGVAAALLRPVPHHHPAVRPFASSARHLKAATTTTTTPAHKQSKIDPTFPTPANKEVAETGGTTDVAIQAPNRKEVWARSQQPRSRAMTGPRFEQTDFNLQPQPWSAMELVHQQPVRWTHDRVVVCDGGGGPAGHPRIYVNLDKPEIAACNYCGQPFAHEHHRDHLEALPMTSYPLS